MIEFEKNTNMKNIARNLCGLLLTVTSCLLSVSCSPSKPIPDKNTQETIDEKYMLEDEKYTCDLKTDKISFFELRSSDEAPQMKRLRDGYNSFLIQTTIWTAIDDWIRFDSCPDSLINAIDCSVIAEVETRKKLESYRSDLLKLTPKGRGDNSVFDQMYDLKTNLVNELVETYNSLNYISLSEDEFWERVDKNHYVEDYDSIIQTRAEDEQLCLELKKKYAAATSFNERAILAIEIAHAGDGSLFILDSLMKQGEYSPYLYEMWKVWRCIYQYMNGASKDSDILNDEFNAMRLVVAETIWKYLMAHPEDEVAINEFTLMSARENIYRYGIYDYGNQNMMEMVELFPERFDTDD